MIGFDTNVLVRYLVRDDPGQSETVRRVVEDLVQGGETAYLNTIVLCETVWVLESGYGYSRPVIAATLEKILLTQQIEVEDPDQVWRALARFREGRGDYADYLIGARNLAEGCRRTVTFDRALGKEEGFDLL